MRLPCSLLPCSSLLCCLLLPGHSPLAAQTGPAVFKRAETKQALAYLAASEPETIQEQITVTEIPAPTFHEQQRAKWFQQRFQQLGLTNVRTDGAGNVIGERKGVGDKPALVLAAHLDTVFDRGTDVKVKREGLVLKAPGIGDDGRGLAVLLAVARAFQHLKLKPQGTLIFVANVGEEGLGDLKGVKHLFEHELKGRITHFVSLDGTGFGITSGAVGSNRFEVTFKGPGGHSYGAFGMANPIHAMGRAIAKIGNIETPSEPKTTFNVGVINGGTSVNSIAHTATMQVDLRSESAEHLAKLTRQMNEAIEAAVQEERGRWQADEKQLWVEVKQVGKRPAGTQPDTAPIVQLAMAADKELGLESRTGASSTDSNLPISLGIPAVTLPGGGAGRRAHALDEMFNTKDSHLGTQRALLVTLGLVGLAQ